MTLEEYLKEAARLLTGDGWSESREVCCGGDCKKHQ
jgi:hypothetical protein